MSSPGKCVFILGMHRSGTSALAGSLHQAGLSLGHVLNHGFELNPKGLWEPPALIYMHEALLEANGGSWQNPPQDPVIWGKLHYAVRDLFIEAHKADRLWGFKEPRTLLVLDGWLGTIRDWTAVGIFRHPSEVAQSLQARNGISLAQGFALWTAYNQRMFELYQRQSFPLIEYTADGRATEAGIAAAIDHLGLRQPSGAKFYEAKLRRFDQAQIEAPPEALALYHALQARTPAWAEPVAAY